MTVKNFFINNRKKIIIFFSSSLILVLLIIFFIKTIYGSWWVIYPQKIKSFISLNRLALLVYEDPLCRVDCYLQRAPFRQEIIKSLDDEKFNEKLKTIIFNEEENIYWRLEIIKVLSLVENREDLLLLNDLRGYLSQAGANLELQRAITSSFNLSEELPEYADLLKEKIINTDIETEQRIEALKNLSLLGEDFSQFYLSLLETEAPDNFKIELLRALGADTGRFNLSLEKLFSSLKNILCSLDSSFTTRRLAIFILSDFLEKDCSPGDCGDSAVYKLTEELILSEELDNFSRYLLIDIFNNYSQQPFLLPEISLESWDYYYDN